MVKADWYDNKRLLPAQLGSAQLSFIHGGHPWTAGVQQKVLSLIKPCVPDLNEILVTLALR